MLEKTFVDKVFYGVKVEGLSEKRRAEARFNLLGEKRIRTLSQLALCLNVSKESLEICEGLDTWVSNQGRYMGEALNTITGQRYDFCSQSFKKSDTEIFTNVVVRELTSNIR